MPYDPSKHHRRSIRLREYDYSQGGAYFVTICSHNRECLFGDIKGGEMHLNPFGEIVLKWWINLPEYYPPVLLDEFIVMPNHMHGIVVIADGGAGSSRLAELAVRTPKRTLGQLVDYFKFQITKEINQVRDTDSSRVLQRDYYEHIIRNDREWNAIADYIRNNPVNWEADLDNPQNNRSLPRSRDAYWNDAGL